MRHREQFDEFKKASERQRASAVSRGRGERKIAALAQIVPKLRRNVPLALDPPGPDLGGPGNVGCDLILQRGKRALVKGRRPVELFHKMISLMRSCARNSRARSRKIYFCTLPEGVRGRSATISSRSGQ